MSVLGLDFVLACGLLAQAPTPAQNAPRPQPPAVDLVAELQTPESLFIGSWHITFNVGATAGTRPPTDEDIEVMRSLLARKLAPGSWARSTATQTGTARDPNSALQDYASWLSIYDATAAQNNLRSWTGAAAVEGVYVDGHGVVFTATLPSLARNVGPAAPAPANPALSEWERARRQLRGEPLPSQAPAAARETSLSDVILHTLAENGKHFSRLRDDERLTVVVVFRGSRTNSLRNVSAASSTLFRNQPAANNPLDPLTGTFTGAHDATGTGTRTIAPAPPQPEPIRQLELLAELHLKQGQYAEALTTLQRAIKQMEDKVKEAPDGPEAVRLGAQYAQLAQALLAAGKVDEARDALEKARKLPKKVAPPAVGAAGKPTGPVLPAKLTVSATKKLLDQVGAGKISFEEFRKEAKVEFYAASGTSEKPAGPGARN
jgi:hypothetical protein